MELAVKDFCICADVNVIYDYCREQGGALAKSLGSSR